MRLEHSTSYQDHCFTHHDVAAGHSRHLWQTNNIRVLGHMGPAHSMVRAGEGVVITLYNSINRPSHL